MCNRAPKPHPKQGRVKQPRDRTPTVRSHLINPTILLRGTTTPHSPSKIGFQLSTGEILHQTSLVPLRRAKPMDATARKTLPFSIHTFASLLFLSAFASSASHLPDSAFLKEVVSEIAAKEKWGREAGIRVTRLEGETARFGASQRYEFYVRAAKKVWAFKFSDEVNLWRRFRVGSEGFGPGLFADGGRVEWRSGVKGFELEGPVELRGVGDGDLSLRLPLNLTHTGLNRIVIGDGIKIKIEGAQEVSFVLPPDSGLLLNSTGMAVREQRNLLWPENDSKCPPLLLVYISGAASIEANKIRDPWAAVETSFSSSDIVEVLSEASQEGSFVRFHPLSSISSLNAKFNLLEKILRSFIGDKILHSSLPDLVKVNVKSSTVVKFYLELERSVGADDKILKNLAEWKTKPLFEKAQFEIVARVEEGKVLKPVNHKKLKRPFVMSESTALNNLMSNISFTQIRNVVVPPEPLTLDVKW